MVAASTYKVLSVSHPSLPCEKDGSSFVSTVLSISPASLAIGGSRARVTASNLLWDIGSGEKRKNGFLTPTAPSSTLSLRMREWLSYHGVVLGSH